MEAAVEFLARRARRRNPDGQFDSCWRWYPSDQERRPCCDGIRRPSRRWPYSLMLHCRTARHVAELFGVDPRALRAALRDARVLAVIAGEVAR